MRIPAKKTLARCLAAFGLPRELRYLYNDTTTIIKKKKNEQRFI